MRTSSPSPIPSPKFHPGLLYWVKRYDFAARGGRGDSSLLYITADTQPDWYNLPSQPSYTRYDAAIYRGWVDKDIAMNAWTTLQIHGIGDPSTGFEPIPSNTFIELLDYVKAAEGKGLWVAPFRGSCGLLPRSEDRGSGPAQAGKR